MKDTKSKEHSQGYVRTMRILDKRPKVSRRGFMKATGVTAVAVTTISTSPLGSAQAWAQSKTTLDEHVSKTLLKMARDVFPHDQLADSYYMTAVDPYDQAAATDAELKALLSDGVATLDAEANKRYGKAYIDVPTEPERVNVLKAMESTPFFQKIRGGLVTALYNNKEVWPILGYEGSSWEQGGYIERGFNDLDWLN